MGFHLVERVYSCVTGTSPTEQAVLAYLAHRADDSGERKCYPDLKLIEAATHLKHTGIRNALNKLREADLLKWKSGGRRKGNGGRASANEYFFNLPVDKSNLPVDKSGKPKTSSGRHAANAGAVTRPMQVPPRGHCSSRQTATINQSQSNSQPSVNGETEAVTEKMKKLIEGVADAWTDTKMAAREKVEIKRQIQKSIIEEAMDAAGVSNLENRKIFSSTIMLRDKEECLSIILEFGELRRAGRLEGLSNPAAALNSRLAALPIVSR